MSPTEIILLAISGALLGALVVSLMILQKLRKERASLAETVRATGGTSLEEAIRSSLRGRMKPPPCRSLKPAWKECCSTLPCPSCC